MRLFGGGFSRFMNRYGLPCDNVVSARLVTASGELADVNERTHPDLLWAIRGAGANFGIVTSVLMNAYPTIDEGRVWAGELTFTGDKLERFVTAMGDLNLTENMTVHWGFGYVGEENPMPMVTAEVFFMRGDAEAGRRAFQSFYDLEPESDNTQVQAYNRLNDDTVGLCEDGGRKPGWHVGLRTLDPQAFREVWNEWTDFVTRTESYFTTVLVESYSNYVLRQPEYADRSPYAHRDINYYAWTIPVWENEEQDSIAEEYGERVRRIWQQTSGFEEGRQRA